jgi:hypothetical protein
VSIGWLGVHVRSAAGLYCRVQLFAGGVRGCFDHELVDGSFGHWAHLD